MLPNGLPPALVLKEKTMKTALLSTLFAFFFYTGQACSCFYISDYFCPSASWFNSNVTSSTLYILQAKVVSIYGYHMDVQVVENLQHTLPETDITILGQDGLNCNEWLGHFEAGKTYILALSASFWEEGVYDLSGCGRFWLPVADGIVQGNINEGTPQQDYEAFKQSLAQCAGITPTESPELASIHLFPNPTAGMLFLNGLEPGAALGYGLYTLTGQMLRSGNIQGGPSPGLLLAGLPPGVYLLRLQAGKAVLTRRVVLKQD